MSALNLQLTAQLYQKVHKRAATTNRSVELYQGYKYSVKIIGNVSILCDSTFPFVALGSGKPPRFFG